jgi:hypothetical protein
MQVIESKIRVRIIGTHMNACTETSCPGLAAFAFPTIVWALAVSRLVLMNLTKGE